MYVLFVNVVCVCVCFFYFVFDFDFILEPNSHFKNSYLCYLVS